MAANDYCLNCNVHIAPAASDRRKVTSTKDGALLGVVHDGKCTKAYTSAVKKGVQVGPPPQALVVGRVLATV
ncbi:MAG: hypothetical protein RL292_324 [Candidatus Parcubacteria bacterium]|jgi:hypothetical protein